MNKQELAKLRFQLVTAVTEYDRKDSTKRNYNIYALPQYFLRIDDILSDVEAGADPRRAIAAGFVGTLQNFVLRKLKMSGSTTEEARGGGSLYYKPVAKKNPSKRVNDDPSRQEMIDYIRKVYGREADEFDMEEAIYWFSNDYHGGQSSNLYSALSTSEYRPGRMSNGPEEGSMGEMIYGDLVDTFSTKKNPVKPRKGEKTKAFVSRCMSEEKVKFPKAKQRIAVCLSKSQARKNPYLESGADISKRSDINRKAASMA